MRKVSSLAIAVAFVVLPGCLGRSTKTEKTRTPVAQAPILELSSAIDSANFISLPAATFEIGSPVSEVERWEDEIVHSVTLTRGFQIQETVVTQSQWLAVMGFNPSKFKERAHCPKEFVEKYGGFCPNHPVDGVSWFDAEEYIQKMNERGGEFVYRLPTEAEWEYAARGGSRSAFHFGESIRKLDEFGWHEGNSEQRTHAVRTRKPNQFGLYDVHGNVFEWVQDWYDPYPEGPAQDPAGPDKGSSRIIRGGSYGLSGFAARSANRGMADPDVRSIGVGFRPVRTLRAPKKKAGAPVTLEQLLAADAPSSDEIIEFFRDRDRLVIESGGRKMRIPFGQFKMHLQVALFVPADYRAEIRKQFDSFKRGAREGSKETGRTLVKLQELVEDYKDLIPPEMKLGFEKQFSRIEKRLSNRAELPALIHETNGLVGGVVEGIFERPEFRRQLSSKQNTKFEFAILRSYLKDPGIAAEFVSVTPGKFRMGSELKEPVRDVNEVPHDVQLTKAFELQRTEVTQLQWYLVMGYNPSEFRRRENCSKTHMVLNGVDICPDLPVEMVSWYDVQGFIRLLNDGGDGFTYRLPSEAEWEFAARAGTTSTFYFGNDVAVLPEYGWFYNNSGDQTHPVAQRKPNPLGLHDMHGGVWEWTQDWYADYPKDLVTDPLGPRVGKLRSIRGGSWFSLSKNLRSANRGNADPVSRASIIGLRLVRVRLAN